MSMYHSRQHLMLHSHHQNYFCIKMGSAESHFDVSLTVVAMNYCY